MRNWQVLQTLNGKRKAEEIVEILLRSRSLKTKKEIKSFFNPVSPQELTLRDLGLAKKNLDQASRRIKKAISAGEPMIVYGDYDADGICGTAILWEALDDLGAQCLPYIPQRLTEGYGLSIQGINNIIKTNPEAKLIITVDNGITTNQAVAYAQKKGIEVIITDHHLPPKRLPRASAIIHTTALSGAGVAWALARELLKHPRGGVAPAAHRGGEMDLSLVAIGTIADMVPLLGANRSLVKYGLRALNRTQRLGLLALIQESGLEKGKIETWQVSFIIAPRLNASGRLADAMDSLRLLCTRDSTRAVKLARQLNQENQRRQRLTEKTFLEAKKTIIPPYPKLLFVASPSYHEGIIGLVAGDLVKEFYRPAVVISTDQEFSKGSARSVEGFNIIKAIRQCRSLLLDCGGHPMAAGLTIATKNLEKLRKKLISIAEKEINKADLTRVLKIDFQLKLSHLTWKLYDLLEKLAPFGVGNSQPVFCTSGLRVIGMRTVGNNGTHLKIKLDDPSTEKREAFPAFDGIGFGLGKLAPELKPGSLVDVAYTLEKNVWNNEERLELKIKDIKTSLTLV